MNSDSDDAPECISNKTAQLDSLDRSKKQSKIRADLKQEEKNKNRLIDQRNKTRSKSKFEDYIPFEEREETFVVPVESKSTVVEPVKQKRLKVERITSESCDFVVLDSRYDKAVQDQIAKEAQEFKQHMLYGDRIKRVPAAQEASRLLAKRSLYGKPQQALNSLRGFNNK